MQKHRIALCITDLEVGGAERCLVDLATRLDRERFEPEVYCLASPPPKDAESCVPSLEAAAIPVHFLDARHPWQFFQVLGRLTRLLKRQKPDLVQTFLFHANLAGRLAGRRAGVGRVLSGIRVAERHSRWHLRLDRLTTELVNRYVCVSQAVADFTTKEGGIPPERLEVIPNGIDIREYPAACPAPPEALGVGTGRRLVTFVGRLERQKGGRWLVETAPRWMEAVPDCDLLMVGKGPEQETLEQACTRLGIGQRVHFLGWRKDVASILAASEVLVLPSMWEGMPNAVLQAMASRLPVVATDVEGVREALGPESSAQTVPYGDSQALARAMVRILSDPRLAAELGQHNRLRAETHFSLDRMVAAYQRLWESLLSE